MSKKIFVNLPVSDLKRSMAFYAAVGATNNPAFTDETAACMVFSDNIYAMLLTHGNWRQFPATPIDDAKDGVHFRAGSAAVPVGRQPR